MAHAHAHGQGHGHLHAERARGQRGLAIALGLTLAVLVAEVIGGLVGGSLALLADAGHMLADAAALGLALLAGWMATRPPAARRTFGWQRAEILAALANGLVLVLIALATVIEAIRRLGSAQEVAGGVTLAVALLGLVFNLGAGAVLLRSGSGLNVRAALRHVLADALSSVGVVGAAVVILATGWEQADPLASLLIAGLILFSAVSIVRESLEVLLESAPRDIDVERLGHAMAAVDGVIEVHDLHVWTVTSGFAAVAAHVTVRGEAEPSIVRRRIAELLRNHFGVEHSTLQVERTGEERDLLQIRPR
ncbi:MAG: cobalt-zinc-cadmium efflux system protein [Gaiellales bacterium]|jgi:cobalt-zinc-cadmium efflux system protein|nr:cobalt-zinc-cadmium efflux system protein [Gaiellales bacterium]